MLSEHNEFLERAYRILNRVYFEDSLPEVVITIKTKKTIHFTYLFFTKKTSIFRVQTKNDDYTRSLLNNKYNQHKTLFWNN